MAVQEYKYGGIGPFYYDDDLDEAFETTGQGQVDTAPTLPNHVVRLQDLSIPIGLTGYTGTLDIITNVDVANSKVKTKTLTYNSGVLITVGAESGWTTAPL
jgi:hypothetical protein